MIFDFFTVPYKLKRTLKNLSLTFLDLLLYFYTSIYYIRHSHKKQKDSLEGSLDRVLFTAELEFPKILVPRLPQHTFNVNTECNEKLEWSKQLYYLYVTSFLGALMDLNFIMLMSICF